jgi:hypothetical protein
LIKKLIRKIFFGEVFLKIWLKFEKIFFEKQPKINPVFLGWVKFSNPGFGWVWVLKFRVRFELGLLKNPGFGLGFGKVEDTDFPTHYKIIILITKII